MQVYIGMPNNFCFTSSFTRGAVEVLKFSVNWRRQSAASHNILKMDWKASKFDMQPYIGMPYNFCFTSFVTRGTVKVFKI